MRTCPQRRREGMTVPLLSCSPAPQSPERVRSWRYGADEGTARDPATVRQNRERRRPSRQPAGTTEPCNRSARSWLAGCAEAANGHRGRKPVGSTLGSQPLVGRLHGLAERLPNRYQSPIGYRRSVPPHVRANARTLLSIRFRYAYGGDQAKIFIIVLQLVTVDEGN